MHHRADRIVQSVCLAVALILVGVVLGSCARPIIARSEAKRGRYWREVTVGTQTCRAELPLVVRFDGPALDLAPDVYAADAVWSEVLGYPVLVPARGDEDHTLFVNVDAPDDDHPNRLAEVVEWCDGPVYRQRMTFFVTGDADQNYYTAMHELGHALGVDHRCDENGHSCDPQSIMYRSVRAPDIMGGEVGPDGVIEMPGQWVRTADRKALRRAWVR